MPHLIDAHCHLSDPRLKPSLDKVIQAANSAGISGFVLGGVHPEDWERQREIVSEYPESAFPCFGLHPWFVAGRLGCTGLELKREVSRGLSLLPQFLQEAVGLGELGLDLGPRTDPLTIDFQKEVFRAQLEIAKNAGKPLVLHVVRAHAEAIALLKDQSPQWRGIVHAFAGSYEIAQEYLQLGLTLSIGGAAARSGSVQLKQGLKKISLDSIVIESDSPDLIPEGFQGVVPGLNDPRSLWRVAEEILKIQERPAWEAEALLQASARRVAQIFGLEFHSPSL